MAIYFKDFRIVDLSFKPTVELIKLLEDLEDGKLEADSDYSIKSNLIPFQNSKNSDVHHNFLVRVDFNIDVKKDGENIDSHFRFVYISEMISDAAVEISIESKDEDFIHVANQIAYSSVKSFIANFFMNSGYNPVYLPLMKMA